MKKISAYLVLIFFVGLISCSEKTDTTTETCNGNCNIFKGRIYREDNVGLADVEVQLKYEFSGIGVNVSRKIAKAKTDASGNFQIEAFIKDTEFQAGMFFISAEEAKIESTIPNGFFKLSDLNSQSGIEENYYIIPNLINRNQITTIDYAIPKKFNLEVTLNNYIPLSSFDYFRIVNTIKYGWQSEFNRFNVKVNNQSFGFANSLTTLINLPVTNGVNNLKINKNTNNIQTEANQNIAISNSNQQLSITY